MKKLKYKGHTEICPVEVTMQILGGKYTTLIVRDLLAGTKRFGEIKKSIPEISTKTLAERLEFLRSENIVNRKVYDVIPLKVEYSLTSEGRSLAPVIDEMRRWGKSKLKI
jgi:DNA-binding HxlR family transcriptional regulator